MSTPRSPIVVEADDDGAVIDLSAEDNHGGRQQKRARTSDAIDLSSHDEPERGHEFSQRVGSSAQRGGGGGRGGEVEFVTMAGGVLDTALRVEAIVQQTNCVGTDCKGLASAVQERLRYGCPYLARKQDRSRPGFAETPAVPGTIEARRPPRVQDGPVVINFNAQWEKGAPKPSPRVQLPSGRGPETAEMREAWFARCLDELSRLPAMPSSIAFPHLIGCGLARGSWARYESMIRAWARRHPTTRVLIVVWPSAGAGGRGGGRGRGRDWGRGGGRGRGGRWGRTSEGHGSGIMAFMSAPR